ncbi:MAG: hypothetical protein AAFP81_13875 [Pseudomonadota bacterium]
MTTRILAVGTILAALTLGACETTSSRPYTVSTQNVMAFQSALGDQKV